MSAPPLYPHGTVSGYTNHRCRCEHCRRTWAAHMAAWTADRSREGIPPEHPAHGTVGGYNNYGCRCEPCRTARSNYQRAYRERRR